MERPVFLADCYGNFNRSNGNTPELLPLLDYYPALWLDNEPLFRYISETLVNNALPTGYTKFIVCLLMAYQGNLRKLRILYSSDMNLDKLLLAAKTGKAAHCVQWLSSV